MENEINVVASYELGKVNINYAEIEADIRKQTEHYMAVVVTEEMIPEFEKARAEINKKIKSLSDERIKIKKLWNQPIDAMETEIKRISGIAQIALDNIDQQLKAFEAKRVQGIKDRLESQFDEYGIDGITFSQVFKPEWTNKGNAKKAPDLLDTEAKRILGDLEFIDGIEDEAEKVLTKENYNRCLNAVTAQSEARTTLSQVRRAEMLRAEKTAQEAQKQATATADVPIQKEAFEFQPRVENVNKVKPSLWFDDEFDLAEAIEVLTAKGVKYHIG